jgi:NAD(P)-dependent dehydrogenase (short-subunit alcohol dehydrogenase family)
MYPDLAGQTAIVTGAASGIGRASAERFGAEGANVVVVDVDTDAGNAVSDDSEDAIFVDADVSDSEDLDRVIERTTDEFGPPTILHNNAAVRGHWKAHETDEADWDRVLGVNLDGVFKLSKRAIPYMLDAGSGAIVNTSSLAGVRGTAGKAPYSTSKGGINALTKEMARDYAADGIRINAVLPGLVKTEMSYKTDREGRNRDAMIEGIPMKRDADPEEIAAVVAFLASEQASYVTGALVPTDGGTSW